MDSVITAIRQGPIAAADSGPANNQPAGWNDIREATFNGGDQGPAYAIAKPVDQVSAIRCFMIDIDCGLLDPAVVGISSSQSADDLYEHLVRIWLDRNAVLAKAEVRNTGHGLHILLQLDEPIICEGDDARRWDKIARGLRTILPGDPKLNGIIAMTRPVGAANTKYEPAKTVTRLRTGSPVSRAEIIDLSQRLATGPARLWLQVFHGGERVLPCPFCRAGTTSLGVVGAWQLRCYECGRVDASKLVYRYYAPEFLNNPTESPNG